MSEFQNVALTLDNAPKQFCVVLPGDDNKLAEAVQQFLFDNLNAIWSSGGKKFQFPKARNIFVYRQKDGSHKLTYSNSDEYCDDWRREGFPEIKIEPSLSVQLFKQAKPVSIGGKLYDEKSVLELFAEHGLAPMGDA